MVSFKLASKRIYRSGLHQLNLKHSYCLLSAKRGKQWSCLLLREKVDISPVYTRIKKLDIGPVYTRIKKVRQTFDLQQRQNCSHISCVN